jgi:hypothetical protein
MKLLINLAIYFFVNVKKLILDLQKLIVQNCVVNDLLKVLKIQR